ncbi:MAG: N-acetyl-gamma-glutamyl-phosphate reductase [Gemmatales bacterium]|nr:N-acetyl-gamma-glutamyl-phosphate reductase [Gemmatales bacterium]MDW8176824.1 N-acetyl-gamma-glutamyl-phosphate reductase [Gemmatales bacterium]
MSDKIRVAILGASGYTARELMLLLLRHPRVEIAAVVSRQEGTPWVAELHPMLTGRLALRCENLEPRDLARRGVQCAFTCLPHGVSMAVVPELLNAGLRVIDLSADYRLREPEVYQEWYREPHQDPAHLRQAVYGLPEIYGPWIREARLVANPGCYPQTVILGLAPLVAHDIIEREDIIADAKSGVSGAGRSPRPHTHFPECNENVSAYNVGHHRHTPEMEQVLSEVARAPVRVLFTPHLVPMDRGIFTTVYARPRRTVSEAELFELYRDYYSRAPFVRVVAHLPNSKDTLGTNFCDVTLRLVRQRIVILSCEDNLVRGASGVAIQNFNLMYGLEETLGLL